MSNYFICTYGNFDDKDNKVQESLNGNKYMLHKAARYPSAINDIQKGDTILLKNRYFIIAWGVAEKSVNCENNGGWDYTIKVAKWNRFTEKNIWEGVGSYGIKSATLKGDSTAVVRKITAKWAENKKQQFKNDKIEFNCDFTEPISCHDLKINNLFEMNLNIPDYQRGYCWRKEIILKFLDGIDLWVKQYEDNKVYHLGTIISKVNNNGIDIIDGQQRLLTLAILLHCLGENVNLLAKISQINNLPLHQGYLIRAKNTINEWLTNKDSSSLINIIKSIQVCLVVLKNDQSEDLAYTFFDTTNSAGKRLSDYDLLKTHHLRYISDDCAEFVANRWNRLETKQQSELLNRMMYRLRNWSDNKKFYINADKIQSHQLFEHFSVKTDPITGIYEIPKEPNFNSTLNGGMEFFSYVEGYRSKFEIFNNLPAIKLLTQKLSCHNNGVLYYGIKAITFLFYCKFGEQYLNEALYCISYRISKLRNEAQVRASYFNDRSIFGEAVKIIEKATLIGEILAWGLDNNETYIPIKDTGTKNWYWKCLGELLAALENNGSFAIKKHTEIITKKILTEGNK